MRVVEKLARDYKEYYGLSDEIEAGLLKGMIALERREIILILQCSESMEWKPIGFTYDIKKAEEICNHTHDKMFTFVSHI